MKKPIIELIRGFIRQLRRNKRWRNAVTCMAALVVFVTTYVLILPAITMEGSYPHLSADAVTGWAGDPMSVTVSAESPAGNGEKVVVLAAEAVDAGLSEAYAFDGDGVAVIEDNAGQEIRLHRTVREDSDGQIDYWFVLAAGQRTEFTLDLQDEIDVDDVLASAGIVKNVRTEKNTEKDTEKDAEKDAEKASASDAENTVIAVAEIEPAAEKKAVTAATAADASKKEAAVKKATASGAAKVTSDSEDEDEDGTLRDSVILNDLDVTVPDQETRITASLKFLAGIGDGFEEAVRDAERNAEKRGDTSLEFSWRMSVDTEKELSWADGGVTVKMFYDADAKIPEGASLLVTEIPQDSEDYQAYLESAKGAVNSDAAEDSEQKVTVNYARFFDIKIFDADGREVEPKSQVVVKIDYEDAEKIAEDADVQMVHFPKEGGTELVEAVVDGDGEALNGVAFSASGFSVYGIVGTGTITIDYLTADGETYKISVDISKVTNIPAEAELVVEELSSDTDEYKEYVRQLEKTLRTEKANFTFTRLFDISIKNDGREIEPDGTVSVKIELEQDAEDTVNVSTVHFTEEGPVVVESDTEEADGTLNEVKFQTDSFSIYAVVGEGEEGEYARMTIHFVNDENEIAQMIVKNGDTAEELEYIIYDPGIGSLEAGELFKGWTMKEDYSADDAKSPYNAETNPNGYMTIADIREWALAQNIKEHRDQTFYAMVFKTFSVAFLDEDGITTHGEALIFKSDDGYTTYTIQQDYTPKNPETSNFEGWYWSSPTDGAVKNTSGEVIDQNTPISVGTKVQISGNVTFSPNPANGYWLIFNANGKNTSYTAPQFVNSGERTVEPEAPTRFGYTFGGWYTDKACTQPFTFGNELSGRTELFAKWDAVETAGYTVIIWKEKSGDTYAENAAEGKTREYDYWKSYNFVGNVGDVINAVSNSSTQTSDVNGSYYDVQISGTRADGTRVRNERIYELGYHAAGYDTGVTIVAEGTSIVNVYYDRHIVTYTFYYPFGYSYTYTPYTGTSNGTYYIPNGSGGYTEVSLYYNNGTWYQTREQEYTYTVSTSTSTGYYYIPDGNGGYTQVYLYRNNGRWYQNREWNWGNWDWDYYNEYTGQVYTRSNEYTYSDPVEGTIYTRTQGSTRSWQVYQAEKGLYGEKLNWPSDTNIFWYPNGNNSGQTSGTRMTYKSDFIPLDADMSVEYYGNSPSGSGTLTFYTQDVTGGNNYTAQQTVRVSATSDGYSSVTFSINDKFTGFVAYQYRYRNTANGNWTNWQNVGTLNPSTGIYGDPVSYGHDLEIRYRRISNTIAYMDGKYFDGNGIEQDESNQGKFYETGEMFYETDLTSYNEGGANYYTPPADQIPAGYAFGGWYADEECTVKYNFTTMPVTGVTVYAKWVKVQYRVFLHPNVSASDISYDIGGQSTSFRVDYNAKIADGSTIYATRNDYELIGWYLDEACTKIYSFDAYSLRDDATTLSGDPLLSDYGKTENTELDKYGNAEAGKQGVNLDKDPNEDGDYSDERFWITKKVDLYAKWRSTISGAPGIRVQYDAYQDDEVTGKIAYISGQPRTYMDPLTYYLDRAEATAAAASTPDDNKLQFLYWVVQTWDESEQKYVDTDVNVYPGDTFEVLKSSARVVDIENPTQEQIEAGITKTYTVQIRAQYGDKEELTPTHIVWYPNFDTDQQPKTVSNLRINEAIDIEPSTLFTREGYDFVGWAREAEYAATDTEHTTPITQYPDAEAWLEWDGSAFTASDTGNTATQIAADERLPYHGMYAVWEPKPYTVTVKKVVEGRVVDETKEFTFSSSLSTDEFTLSHSGTKVFKNVDYDSTFTVSEAEDAYYMTTYTYKVGEDGEETAFEAGASITVKGDMYVTVTNTQKVYSVDIAKTDKNGGALDGAVFEVLKDDGTGYRKYLDENVTVDDFENLQLVPGDYELVEKTAPKGYIIATNKYHFSVSTSGSLTVTSTDTFADGTVIVTKETARTDGSVGTVSVKNEAGKELPHTGGSGTLPYTLGGLMLAIASALMYGFRMRRRERRLN